MNLAGFDLNLLVAFEALMAERSVSRAAGRIGLSQPSMSNLLRRMRAIFEDELFYRTAEGMMPSATAIALSEAVTPALTLIRSGLDTQLRFDPRTTDRSFAIGMPDVGTVAMMPILGKLLRRQAPNISIKAVGTGGIDIAKALTNGDLDIAVGEALQDYPQLTRAPLSSFPYFWVADRHNPAVKDGRLSPGDLARLSHIADSDLGPMDAILAERGLKRRVALWIQHSQAVIPTILGTDLIALLPSPTIIISQLTDRLAICPDPLGLPLFKVETVWHRRHDTDASHRWLREQIILAARRRSDGGALDFA